MPAIEVLVIFLSVALAIFLALAIVLTVYLIIIAQKIKRVASSAEQAVSGVASVINTFKKAAAPAVISRFVIDQISNFTAKRNKNKEDN